MQPNEPEITKPKSITDNSVILNAVDMLLTSAGFNKDPVMNKFFFMPFFVISTLIPNSVYANSERRQFVNICSNELVGVYANRTANKICDCAYDYWKAGGDPATGGYLCALEHANY